MLIIAVLVSSGCTTQELRSGFESVTTTEIKDILRNPEDYINKTVKIRGVYNSVYLDDVRPEAGLSYKLTDRQGYKFFIKPTSESGRTLYTLYEYYVEGFIRSVAFELCQCQRREIYYDEWVEKGWVENPIGEWEDYNYLRYGKYVVNDCLNLKENLWAKRTEYRCKPNSTAIEKIYYIEAIEMERIT